MRSLVSCCTPQQARRRRRRSTVALATVASVSALLFTAMPQAAHAQANLSFTGGNGIPLTLTLAAPVTYIANTASASGSAPFIVFQNVGNVFAGTSLTGATGTITYRINNGAAQTINYLYSGFNGGNTTSNDLYIFRTGSLPGINVNDVVVLTSGTLTSQFAPTDPPPANGSFNTFLINNSGTRLSPNGVAGAAVGAPEPGTLPLLGMGLTMGAGMVGTVKRRKAIKQAA